MQKQPPEVFCKKKGFLKNFADFTGKHLCWSLFLITLQGEIVQHKCSEVCETFKNTYFEEYLQTSASGRFL